MNKEGTNSGIQGDATINFTVPAGMYKKLGLPEPHPFPYTDPATGEVFDNALVESRLQAISDALKSKVDAWIAGGCADADALIPRDLLPDGWDFEAYGMPKLMTYEQMEREVWSLPSDKNMQVGRRLASYETSFKDHMGTLYADPACTYICVWNAIAPYGHKLVVEGEFPHARSFTIQNSPAGNGMAFNAGDVAVEDNTYGCTEAPFFGQHINPEPGSVNPFVPGSDRDAPNRKYRVEFLLKIGNCAALNPEIRPPRYTALYGNKNDPSFAPSACKNQLYAGLLHYQGPARQFGAAPGLFQHGRLWIRFYKPDMKLVDGRWVDDPYGGVSVPRIWYETETGFRYFIYVDHTRMQEMADASGVCPDEPSRPVNWEYPFANGEWGWRTMAGIYDTILAGAVCGVWAAYRMSSNPTPEGEEAVRAARLWVAEMTLAMGGRGQSVYLRHRGLDPSPKESDGCICDKHPGSWKASLTCCHGIDYFISAANIPKGSCHIMTGYMPTFPHTRYRSRELGQTEALFWSITGYYFIGKQFKPGSPLAKLPMGLITCSVSDDHVTLDQDRMYVICFSRAEDRPANALAENGVTWIDVGRQAGTNFTMRIMSVYPYHYSDNNTPHELKFDILRTEFGGFLYDKNIIGRNGFVGGNVNRWLPKLCQLTTEQFQSLPGPVRWDSIPEWKRPVSG